jgi:hypothetical protein
LTKEVQHRLFALHSYHVCDIEVGRVKQLTTDGTGENQ